MSNMISIPDPSAVEEAWQEAIPALPTHDADFYEVLRSLPLTRAQVIELEETVNAYVSANEKTAFYAGYAAGLSGVNVIVMN